jgi:Tfp pilus assembly protein PilN
VRAVNLLPSDLRRAGSGGGSGSPVASYALLAGLAVAVLLVGLWATTGRQVKDREAEVAQVNAEASAAEAQAANLAGYEGTVQVANTRRASVVGLIDKRFDWSAALEDISRTLPQNAWITTMTATVAPGVAVEGGSNNPQRGLVNAPAVELTGCTTSQSEVAALMSRLRSMKGVTKVGLATSEKSEGGGGESTADSGASGGATSADCSQSSDQRPKFNLIVFYGDGAPAEAGAATPNNAAAATAATAPSDGGSQ